MDAYKGTNQTPNQRDDLLRLSFKQIDTESVTKTSTLATSALDKRL